MVEYCLENKNEELYQTVHNRRRFYLHDLRSRRGLILQLLRPGVDFQDTCSSRPKFLFVCVEVLRPSQQLRSCRAGQLPINTVPGQA